MKSAFPTVGEAGQFVSMPKRQLYDPYPAGASSPPWDSCSEPGSALAPEYLKKALIDLKLKRIKELGQKFSVVKSNAD